ncbi:hypothetical protein NPX13_g8647 [Xylaria arbuscula]|uniref:Uncharacterized protein n=1 Tax=Xylaria arbuscula TaxID=114810 RepID=A0A9W8N8A5_9PEZI|nr:hypothetical protein NPX13_g8647 [Xylaria arbuscula]
MRPILLGNCAPGSRRWQLSWSSLGKVQGGCEDACNPDPFRGHDDRLVVSEPEVLAVRTIEKYCLAVLEITERGMSVLVGHEEAQRAGNGGGFRQVAPQYHERATLYYIVPKGGSRGEHVEVTSCRGMYMTFAAQADPSRPSKVLGLFYYTPGPVEQPEESVQGRQTPRSSRNGYAHLGNGTGL